MISPHPTHTLHIICLLYILPSQHHTNICTLVQITLHIHPESLILLPTVYHFYLHTNTTSTCVKGVVFPRWNGNLLFSNCAVEQILVQVNWDSLVSLYSLEASAALQFFQNKGPMKVITSCYPFPPHLHTLSFPLSSFPPFQSPAAVRPASTCTPCHLQTSNLPLHCLC